MRYSQEELTEIGGLNEDAHIPDSLSSYNVVLGIGHDEAHGEDFQGWNLRRCAAVWIVLFPSLLILLAFFLTSFALLNLL
jgi:hypothetical protein